jgi:hypothetical protein
VKQSRNPTNRNRIRGKNGRTSGQAFAKSISNNDRHCKSDGCAMKAVELTPRDLRRCPSGLGALQRMIVTRSNPLLSVRSSRRLASRRWRYGREAPIWMLTRNDRSDPPRRNVYRRSFSSANARCAGWCKSMLHTTIENGTIKGSRMSCCSRRSRKHAGRGLCDVANGSADSCATTIKKPRELAGQAIMKPTFSGYRVRLTVRKFARGTVDQATIDGQFRGVLEPEQSDLRIAVEQSRASAWYFDSTA